MPLNWIVPYSSVSNLNCASFRGHQSKLCLNPITQKWNEPNSNLPQWLVPYSNASNWIVPYSNPIKLNCASFQLSYNCIVPFSNDAKWNVPYSNITKWIVPYSFSIKLKCALFQCQEIELCLIPMSHFEEETSTDQLFLLHSRKSVFDLPIFVSDLPMFVSDLAAMPPQDFTFQI